MRTTVRLDDDLLARAKAYAARGGTSLTRVIEDALRVLLERAEAPRQSRPFKMVTFKGNGVQPGVDLDDSAALLDRMEDVE
ncbi:MAG: DUF6364 family protein [Actinomycetota bacterium]